MFSLYLRNRNGSRSRALVRALAATFCLLTAFMFVGCKTDDDGDYWKDDNQLNPDLIGTWFADFGGGYTDTYTITATTISHPEAYPAYADAEIVYVYNFNAVKTAGALIIRRKEEAVKEKPYNAVFFKDLSKKDKVLLGDAYVVSDFSDSSVATLDEAKSRFGPMTASIYGGGSAQVGSPIAWQ